MVLPGQLIPSPLRIFRNIEDDSVEETLRAMHLANTVDNTYEWGIGWVRTFISNGSQFRLESLGNDSRMVLYENR
jgi:hypothetical protein